MNAYALLVLSILIGIGGQISLKTGAVKNLPFPDFLLSPSIMLGLSAYAVSAILYIMVLRTVPLSVAFPSVSVSYVAVALIAHYIWGEPFGAQQLIALALIASGIYLLFMKVNAT